MSLQDAINYNRIAAAIDFIRLNFREQPTLEEIAAHVNISPFYFQRMFTEWAGTSPKKFLQYISLEYAKKLLKESQASLFDTAFETGLSGSSRLHDLFITIEGMTPAEYKYGGRDLQIRYSYAPSLFGDIIIASTDKGICYLAFCGDKHIALGELKKIFPHATYSLTMDSIQQQALQIFGHNPADLKGIRLHVKGTGFQLKVWEALLKIPQGQLATYGDIAGRIGKPDATRAVGTAIGKNPIAYLIPCHRVIQSGGTVGGYRWGSTRKTAIIGWEGARVNGEQ